MSAYRFGREALRLRLFTIVFFALLLMAVPGARAAPSPIDGWSSLKRAVIVYDVNGDEVLHARNADLQRYPASLTKIMTLYILFEELDKGRFSLGSRLKVSKRASGQPASKLGLARGTSLTVEEAINALIVRSANDVATVVAEGISGSEIAFAARMTNTARALGMGSTTFTNASGLPNRRQKTSARDLLKLAVAMIENHPRRYAHFNKGKFTFRGTTYHSHNRLIRTIGVDGMKTGFTNASGFNLISSMRRDGRHLIVVLLGGPSGKTRDSVMRKLLERYIADAKRAAPARSGSVTTLAALPQARSTVFKADTVRRDQDRQAALREVEALALAARLAQLPQQRPSDKAPIQPAPEPPLAQRAEPRLDELASAAADRRPVSSPTVQGVSLRSGEAPRREAPSRPGLRPLDDTLYAAWIGGQSDPLIIDEFTVVPQRASDRSWGMQIGASPTVEGATRLLLDVRDLHSDPRLRESDAIVERVRRNGNTFYRARFVQLSETDATSLCTVIKTRNDCYIFLMRN